MTAVDIICHLIYTGIICILIVSIRFFPLRLLILLGGLSGLSSVLMFSREVSLMLHSLFVTGANLLICVLFIAIMISLIRSCF